MTGPEREDFRELQAEMREGFLEVGRGLAVVAQRVTSLETTRSSDVAVTAAAAVAAASAAASAVAAASAASAVAASRRWRITAFLTGAAAAAALLGAAIQVFHL